jgi:hypothetical protein
MWHWCLRFLQSRPRINKTNLIKKKCNIDASDSSYRSHEYTNPADRNPGKNQVVRNIIVEIIDSKFEHFMICEYVYDIQPLGKCFLNTSINESCQEGWWKKVMQNVIVENIDSGVEHFIIFIYVYDIKPLGKWFFNTWIQNWE